MTNAAQGFAGLRVAAFESRRAGEMASLIERFGGVALVSPSMREVPIEENREAIDFANHIITGQIDIVIFMTGVGIRHLLAEVERHVDRRRLLESISDIATIARGPKPVAVLKELGLEPKYKVGPPNTWREVLALVDQSLNISQQVVGLVEYGVPNASLVAGLEARGARVETVRVYRWDLPLDQVPLEANIRALAAGQIDVAMFTSSHQVVNMLRVAERLQLAAQLRDGMSRAWSHRSVPPPARRCTNSTFRWTSSPNSPAWASSWRPPPARPARNQAISNRPTRPTLPANRPRPSPAHGMTARSCALAAASRWIARPSGSCVRRAATWPSIARCAKRFRFSSCARIQAYAPK